MRGDKSKPVPGSIREIRLETIARRLRDRLQEVERKGWTSAGYDMWPGACPECESRGPHDSDCDLAADLAEADRVLGPSGKDGG